MGPFVLDASVTLSWCFADEASQYSRDILSALRTTYAVVPALWPFEIANSLAIAARQGRIPGDGIAEFLESLRELPIQVERRESLWICQEVVRLSHSHGLSAYDAAYLELAKREGLALAT